MKHTPLALALATLCLPAFAQQREKDDRQAAREEWFYSQRTYPRTQIPAGARIKAIAEIQRIDRDARSRHLAAPLSSVNAKLATTLDSSTWTSIGPKPTDFGSTYVTAGRVNAIAIDPRDNNIVYMGAAEGGVWKTTDGGANWTPLTDDQPSLASGAIAIDPSNPDTVYVGTGEENFAIDSYYGAGILKSTDAGATWTNLASDTFLRATIGRIAVHPTNGQVLLCAANSGLWRSTDGAVTWTRVLTGTAIAAVFDPTNPDIAYSTLGNVNGSTLNGVYRSTDAGQTWTLTMGSGANSLPAKNVGRIDLTIAASTPTTLYVGIQDSSSANFGNLLGIYKTTDSGATWNNLNAPNICASLNQCWYDMSIRVNPTNPDVIFAVGSLSIIRSLDGGANWSQLNFIGPNRVEIHTDEHYLAFTNDGTKLYIGNDGGMYSTTDITNPQVNWTELNDTLGITQFYPGISVHPSDSNIGFGGAQDNGTQRYGGAASWNNVTCGDGGSTAIDFTLPTIAYAACQSIQVLRTATGGNNWSRSQYGITSSDRVQFIPPMVIDPSNSQTVYFGTFRLWQTRDGGGKWIAISPDLTGGKSTLKAIAPSPSDPNTVFVGFANGKVYSTNDALDGVNATWTERTTGLAVRAVTGITVDPIDPATAYVTFSGFSGVSPSAHVYRTKDGGANWTDISGNLPDIPVNALVVDPDILDTLYIGTDAGVMISTDAGVTWSSLGKGLPRVVVTGLALQRSGRLLRAGTHGRSMWDILVPLPSDTLQPTLAAASPSSVDSGGGDFTLVVTGKNFAPGTTLRWNGFARPTNVLDATHLNATIAASDIAQAGRASIDAFSPSRGVGVSNSLLFNIGPAPSTAPAAFVNDAYPLGGSALAPGSIASLYGVNLGSGVSIADVAPPLPFSLGGTTMLIANAPVPLFFVSPGQINFQVPWILSNGPVQVPLNIALGQLNQTITVVITPFAPGLFTTNSQGTGQASALIAGTGTIVAPVGAFQDSRPAQKGEFVSLYCTGLGNVTRRPSAGSPSPSTNLAFTLTSPNVTVGGVNVTSIPFSGLAPGFVGLYQVNIQIPDTAPSGDAVDVVLTIGGVKSNTATIAVQ
ncbi:MAG TPA: hypothetical protein VEU96_21540 [Bryobacteraceae bacterium]|nr:hypothetical protein [Bryobacteraceae bacterium]